MVSERVFVSLTHGKHPDCQQANSSLIAKLEAYRFDAYLIEKNCFRCTNDDCNISIIFILRRCEFLRLKNQVDFDTRPTFVVHTSFKELISLDRKLRDNAIERNSFGVQVGPETVNAEVDAIPETRVLYVQTDFMVGKKDTGSETDNVVCNETSCQTDSEPEKTVASTECHCSEFAVCMPAAPVVTTSASISLANQCSLPVMLKCATNSEQPRLADHSPGAQQPSLRSLEVQQDDENDDVVFVEIRSRSLNAVREVKIEEQEAIEPPQQLLSDREVKEEVVEPVPAEDIHAVNSTVESISQTLLSTVLVTPKTSSSRESIFAGSAKRMKFSDVDMCDMCSDVTHFSSLEEYCSHVLEVHVSLCRYKCTVCGMRFFSSRNVALHAHKHSVESEEDTQLITSEIPDEHVRKFVQTANRCYPEKFRNIPIDELIEIIHKLP